MGLEPAEQAQWPGGSGSPKRAPEPDLLTSQRSGPIFRGAAGAKGTDKRGRSI